jgi:hypothetical protein
MGLGNLLDLRDDHQDYAAHGCPLLVMWPLPPCCIVELPPLARRLQPLLGHYLWHADDPLFRSMFQVFHVSSDVCCKCCI